MKVRLKEMYDAVEIGNVKGIAWFVCWWGGNKMSFFENTKKPEGLGGKIMVAMMNSGHGKLADWGDVFPEPVHRCSSFRLRLRWWCKSSQAAETLREWNCDRH